MATVKALLDKRRKLNDGTYPLVVRIFNGRTFKDLNLKTYLKEAEFDNESQKVTGKHPNKKLINQAIHKAVLQVQQTALSLEMGEEVVTSEKIKNRIVKPIVKLNFNEYGWLKVEELKAANKYGNSCFYRDALNALKNYTGKTNISFREINYQFLKQLENKMLANGVKVNTIALCMRTIRAIYNKAMKEKLVDKSYYPFEEYKIISEPTAKRAIQKQDILKLIEMSLKRDTGAYRARDYFVLSFLLRGMPIVDMAGIRDSDITNGRLIYKRKKTHKIYNVKIIDRAKELLDKYRQEGRTFILPIIPENAVNNPALERKHIQLVTKTCNKFLRRLGKELNLEQNLTTYAARHSFATIAKKMGFSKDLISEALGHSFGNRITEIYLDSFDQQVIDDMTEAVCKF